MTSQALDCIVEDKQILIDCCSVGFGGISLKIIMAGVDYTTASVEKREPFAFTKIQIQELLQHLQIKKEVSGAVLICTCNRTELYLSVYDDAPLQPDTFLASAAGLSASSQEWIITRTNELATRHLMEVTCGLRSALRGDDQILTQVREALEFAREMNSTDPVIETLFRLAITAAKRVKRDVKVRPVPISAAKRAVDLLCRQEGSLSNKKVLVIGNGEMGRTAAALLVESGAKVTITLRTYRHGETTVPYGCQTIPYDERTHAIAQADILISATTSPHFTVTKEMLSSLPKLPTQFIDLAVPRDIDPATADLPGVHCLDIDALGEIDTDIPSKQLHQIQEICEKYLLQFTEWNNGRTLRETANLLSVSIQEKVSAAIHAGACEGNEVNFAVQKAVESVLFSLKGDWPPELLQHLRQIASQPNL